MSQSFIVKDSRTALGATKLNGDCIDDGILDGQQYARTTYSSDLQSRDDYVAVARARGYTRTWCIVLLVFALLYLGVSIVTFIFAANAETFDLITADSDDLGNPTPSFETEYPLGWIFAVFPLLVAILYGSVALFGGEDYLGRRMYARGEAYTIWGSYFLHMLFQGAAALIFTGYLYRTSFFIIFVGFSIIVSAAYLFVGHEAGLSRGWTFPAIIAYVVATIFNVIFVVLLIYGMATRSLEGWEYVVVSAYIVGILAYWAHVAAWIFGWGTYAGGKAVRNRIDIFGIVSITILLVQSLFIHVPYILYGLDLV